MSLSKQDASNVSSTYGNFRRRKSTPTDITFNDFNNPWTFFGLFINNPGDMVFWLQNQGLLIDSLTCPVCQRVMKVMKREKNADGLAWRCARSHERSIRINSWFDKSKIGIQDIMLFIKLYLDENSLKQCSLFSGIAYHSTSVDWGSMIRELFKEYFERHVKNEQLSGEIEIDESLFGRKIKYHKGAPHGMKIWVFGMVQRSNHNLIMYPVDHRDADTLIPLILQHVKKGSTIYSDGWSAYLHLNQYGYQHFTVLHKYAFKKIYKNSETGEEVEVHTNTIEGSWKHAKNHFKRMSGTSCGMFEGHLAEVVWRSRTKRTRIYDDFFTILKEVYPLNGPATYTYSNPLFPTWTSIPGTERVIVPERSDVESLSEEEEYIPPSDTDSSTDHIEIVLPDNVTRRRRRRLPSQNICCPANFQPIEEVITVSSSCSDDNHTQPVPPCREEVSTEVYSDTPDVYDISTENGTANSSPINGPHDTYVASVDYSTEITPKAVAMPQETQCRKKTKKLTKKKSHFSFTWSSDDDDFV